MYEDGTIEMIRLELKKQEKHQIWMDRFTHLSYINRKRYFTE